MTRRLHRGERLHQGDDLIYLGSGLYMAESKLGIHSRPHIHGELYQELYQDEKGKWHLSHNPLNLFKKDVNTQPKDEVQ